MAEQVDGFQLRGPSQVTKMDAKLRETVEGPDGTDAWENQPEPFNPTVQPKNVVRKTAIYGGVVRSSETPSEEV